MFRSSPPLPLKKDGYALCALAANQCILPTGRQVKLKEFSKGATHTILFGEVSNNLRPWGDPVNARDPRLGLNSNPYGFGNPVPKTATLFVFGDSSVRALNDDIDPQVLKALSMPDQKNSEKGAIDEY